MGTTRVCVALLIKKKNIRKIELNKNESVEHHFYWIFFKDRFKLWREVSERRIRRRVFSSFFL